MMAAERTSGAPQNASDAVQPPAPRPVQAGPGAVPPPDNIVLNLALAVVMPPAGSLVAGPINGAVAALSASQIVANLAAGPMNGNLVAGPMNGNLVAGPMNGNLVAGPMNGNLVAGPMNGTVVALPAGPIVANLAGAFIPPGGRFDITEGLLGPPPKRSNLSFKIWL